MKRPLWNPSDERVKSANMTRYMGFVNDRYRKNFTEYRDLYRWSVENVSDFWKSIWDFVGIEASRKYIKSAEDLSKFPGTKWFPGATLNFAQNLLRNRDERVALVSKCESKPSVYVTYEELYDTVARVVHALRGEGVTRHDRVVAYMPNIAETVISMLAVTSLGATWASCGSELGAQAVIERFAQIKPKILFAADGYIYKNKQFDMLPDVKAVVEAVPSIEKVVIIRYVGKEANISSIPKAIVYDEFLLQERSEEILFEQVPFDHPVYIMFSSGTTGKPKCMVQSVGGVLINHLKELVLHADLKRDDTIMYMTAPSWMMWNWLIGALGVGAKVVLFDGNPGYPDLGTMWRLVDEEKITFFGTSATYINMLKREGYHPKERFDLSSLRSIGQTGSPLSAEGFEFVYQCIKSDVHLNSLSGGTDINGCFAMGCPILPVYPGELQGPALGMKIRAYDEGGNSIQDTQGELVCEAPAPSMPLYFLNDPDFQRYKDAYFGVYKNVWRHGDYVTFYRDTKGLTFFGRSDAILKPSGVRIGTAEIYNILDTFSEITDSVVVGQNWKEDQRLLLFVKLAPGVALEKDLESKIKKALKEKASPRHVPAVILCVPDIPYTFSGKKVEGAIANIVNGRAVNNRDALANPESLEHFESVLHLLQEG